MATVSGWAQRLQSTPDALAYLTKKRGLANEVIQAEQIGWDGDSRRLTFPMVDLRGLHPTVVALKTRRVGARAQMIAWPGKGRAWPLYPEPSAEHDWRLLVAGELDALRGRTVGLPATSVTLGAGTWRDDWTEVLRRHLVVVCFDNNEQAQARERVAQLRRTGIEAVRLDLRSLGLRVAKGHLSNYLDGNRARDRLARAVIREATRRGYRAP